MSASEPEGVYSLWASGELAYGLQKRGNDYNVQNTCGGGRRSDRRADRQISGKVGL